MDIVQYLHGLVSMPLGISNEDTSADLLKQYYALSVAHIVDTGIDIKDKKNHSLLSVWEARALPLAKRLARSFHTDETQTLTLLRSVTPLMMVELNGVVGGMTLSDFVAEHFHYSRTHLPSWSAQFIEAKFLIALNNRPEPKKPEPPPQAPSEPTPPTLADTPTETNTTDAPSENTPSDMAVALDIPTDNPLFDKPAPKANSLKPLLIALAVVLPVVIAGGVWWYLQTQTHNEPTVIDPNIPTPNVQTLDTPRLSITSGESHSLYACQAKVGNYELHDQLISILQKNFNSAGCIIDIDNTFGSSLVGLERLDSIIAMLKSEPFSSMEIIGDEIFINTPNPQILDRLVNDISLLAPQFKVSATPPLDVAHTINDSINRATSALNALDNPPNAYDLARALSLQIIDFGNGSEVPVQNQAVLALAGEKLSQNPNAHLLIATHTDTSGGNRAGNLELSQAQANALRAFLMQHGASEAQLTAKGVGDTFPVADNVTTVGKFKNRRTEFLVYDEAIVNAFDTSINSINTPNVVNGADPMATLAQNIATNNPSPSRTASASPMPVLNTAPPPIEYTAQPIPATPITPMPTQGMPQGITNMPQPVSEIASGGGYIVPGMPIAESSIDSQSYSSHTPSSPSITISSTKSIAPELDELSKPVHAEGSKGVSYEIRD